MEDDLFCDNSKDKNTIKASNHCKRIINFYLNLTFLLAQFNNMLNFRIIT